MRATVFLREEKIAKPVGVTDQAKPLPEQDVLDQWQGILDNLASLLKIPSALIMRLYEDRLEVLLSCDTEGNPYRIGDCMPLGAGRFCETVVGNNEELMVKDARYHDAWQGNPDLSNGMVSYYGLPIAWPDGEIFGTVCTLDRKERFFSRKFRAMFRAMRDSIEKDLRLAVEHQALTLQNAFLKQVIDTIPTGILLLDRELRVALSNERARNLIGFPHHEMEGRRPSELIPHPQIQELETHFVQSGVSDYPIEFDDSNGVPRHYLVDYQSIYSDHHELTHIAVNIRNVSHIRSIEDELTRKNEVLSQLAVRDRLTGMYNHVTIHELLLKKLEESIRYRTELSIAMVDIDRFKEINDSFGHRQADGILVSVSRILRENVRGADIIGRYGGNRFMVIMPQTELDSAYQVIERVRQNCASRSFDQIDLTISAGVCRLENESSMDKLINCAEQALYRAKSIGRNVVVIKDKY